MASVEKWQANREKVARAKSFPGQLSSWAGAAGKRVENVILVDGHPVSVVIFADKTFLIAASVEPEPAQILAALLAARSRLDSAYPQAYRELDDHISRDKELTRKARLDNIIGAIRNNLDQLPELPDALEKLLADLKKR